MLVTPEIIFFIAFMAVVVKLTSLQENLRKTKKRK